MVDERYRIGELALAADVNPRTIDFYTRVGLLKPDSCTKAKYRLYSAVALQRLETIQELRSRRYTLKQIRAALDRPSDDLVAATARAQAELDQLAKSVDSLKGMPLDARAHAALTALALKSISLSYSLLVALEEGKHLL